MAGTSNHHPSKAGVGSSVSRRGFLKGVGVAAVAAEGLLERVAKAAETAHGDVPIEGPVSGDVKIVLSVNGQNRVVTVEPRTTLLSALRDRLDPAVTGPKLVCNAGTCGACTVLYGGKPVYGCSVLAVDAIGKEITTVEGLGTPENLSPVQAAFVEKDAMMCGFCTSGFVTSVTALLKEKPNPTFEEVREGCKGNFCRCGTYPHVFAAALTAAKNMRT
jgi:xanthine dehydrogenase YagT iron-sulfur-binding subunit